MKFYKFTLIFALTCFLSSCKNEKKNDNLETEMELNDEYDNEAMNKNDEVKEIAFNLESKSDSSTSGKVIFTEENGQVSMVVDITGATEGKHAIHIHEKADCSSDDGKSTGGHWNPTAQPHGQWGDEEGYHRGDIGNFEADAEGNAQITMTTNKWCIGCDDDNKNIIDKAIIVHEGVDDFTSQPSGAAGTRISCGAIIQ